MPGRQFDTVALPKRLQLVALPNNRNNDFTKDARLVNCYVEEDPHDGEFWIVKRPGFSEQLVTITGSGINPTWGLYKFYGAAGTFQFLVAKNSRLSKVTSNLTGPTVIGNIGSSQNAYVFETLRSTPNFNAVLNDGANAYYTDGTTLTSMIGLANFPTAIVKGWAYLNGYLYVMDRTNRIYNSQNLDDPTVWSLLNVIVARNGSDPAVALAKHKEYVVALKGETTEFFFDAGNPTGSPLLPLQGSLIEHGLLTQDLVQSIDSELFWVTNDYQVIRLTSLRPDIISVPTVERLIRGSQTGIFIPMGSYSLKLGGHRFFCIYFDLTGVSNRMTMAYDLDQKRWFMWTDASGTGIWPIAAIAGPDSQNRMVMQNYLTGNLHAVGEDFVYPNDALIVPPVDIYTVNHDFGTRRDKTLAAMYFRGNQTTGSILQVRYSDNDYQTWSNFRDLDLGTVKPFLTDLGSFTNRAFDFRHQSNTTFRLKTTDLQIDIGTG